MIKNILKLIRVKQWIKNAFVLAPLLFSLKFTEMGAVVQSALAFAAFCFIASAVYVMNDILDRKKMLCTPRRKTALSPAAKYNP